MKLTIPLFPLKTVLFPGGFLPLRVFEPRYLDMISSCLKNDTDIGVVMIRVGSEVGKAADTHEVGTLTNIDYFHRRNDGLLGVTLVGKQRFRILSRQVQSDQLILAEVELLEELPETIQVEEEYRPLVDLLKQIINQLEAPFTKFKPDYEDANWVSARLVELLPFELQDKQHLLTIDDARRRLQDIAVLLQKMDI